MIVCACLGDVRGRTVRQEVAYRSPRCSAGVDQISRGYHKARASGGVFCFLSWVLVRDDSESIGSDYLRRGEESDCAPCRVCRSRHTKKHGDRRRRRTQNTRGNLGRRCPNRNHDDGGFGSERNDEGRRWARPWCALIE